MQNFKYLLLSFVFFTLLLAGLSQAQEYPTPVNPESTESLRIYPSYLGTLEPASVELGPPKVEGATRTITFNNTMVNGPHHTETYDLTHEGFRVTIDFVWSGGNDTLTVIPPEGFVSVPSSASVPEGTLKEFHIYQYLGG
jgi:hypothetical protein